MSCDVARGIRLAWLCAVLSSTLLGCSRRDSTPPEPMSLNTPQAAPAVSTIKFAIAVHDDSPQRTLLVCSDIETTPEKAAAATLPQGATRMDRRCETLRHVPLTSCALGNVVEYYYVAQYSDTYQPSCLQRGGRWEANQSAEAQAARAEQAAQGAR